jgi:1-pyrroline-5-carboxylate dehydrogenase
MAKSTSPKITYVTLFADESVHPKYEVALERFKKQLGQRYPMFIGEEEVLSEDGEFEHHSPIDTSITVGRFQVGTRSHAKLAIASAKKAFPRWRGKSWQERVRIMDKAADLIDERKFDIAVAVTFEVGKNRLEALAECWEAIDAIKFYSKIMEKNNGYVEKMDQGVLAKIAR